MHPVSSPPGPWQIAEAFDVSHAAALRDLLLRQADATTLVLDLSCVPHCDVAGLQLLLAARASAAVRGHTFVVAQPSAAVLDACAALGVSPARLSTP